MQINASHSREIADASLEDFNRLLSINTTGTFLVTSCVSAAMKSQEPKLYHLASPDRGSSRGSIVNLGSAACFVPIPKRVQYTASKHAVLGLTKNAGMEPHQYGLYRLSNTNKP